MQRFRERLGELSELGKIGAQVEEIINSDSELSLHMDPYAEGGFVAQIVEIPENQKPAEVDKNLHPVLIRQNKINETGWDYYGALIYWADDDEIAEVFPLIPNNDGEKKKTAADLVGKEDKGRPLNLEEHRRLYGLWITAESQEDFQDIDRVMEHFFPYDKLNLDNADLEDVMGVSKTYSEQKMDRVLGFWIQRQISSAIEKRVELETRRGEEIDLTQINSGLNTLTGAKEIIEEALGIMAYDEKISNKVWKGAVGAVLVGYHSYDEEQLQKGDQEVKTTDITMPYSEIDLKARENFYDLSDYLIERYPKLLKEVYQDREDIRDALQGDEYAYLRDRDYFEPTESET